MSRDKTTQVLEHENQVAVLDSAHLGDIRGGLGTIRVDDAGPRTRLSAKVLTLLAIVGPGLIVMVGDNDAGAFATYTQAGQNYGTRLLWTLMLLVPVLYVNQEMVLRLGAVTGVGHALLILERFGRFWGAFSVIDLFLLNGLTIITEFIGISLGLSYLACPRRPAWWSRRWWSWQPEAPGRFGASSVCASCSLPGHFIIIPIIFMIHPSAGGVATDFVLPGLPHDAGSRR